MATRPTRDEPQIGQEYIQHTNEDFIAKSDAALKILRWFMLGCFAVVVLRILYFHFFPPEELEKEKAYHTGTIVLAPPRGDILDRNKLKLAGDRIVPSLWLDPRKIFQLENVDDFVMRLGRYLEVDVDELLQRINARDANGNLRAAVLVKRWIQELSQDELEEIVYQTNRLYTEALGKKKKEPEKILWVQTESLRVYPQGETAAHVLGFVNKTGEVAEGLERSFDKYLRSTQGRVVARKDATRRLLLSATEEYIPPQGGDTIYTTLDTVLQKELEKRLDARIQECNARGGKGIILDPYTGAILALAVRPSFDPNRYNEYPPELRKNRALIDVFEPGSCFKIIVGSAALEHNLVTPETPINCEGGTWNPYGHTIRDFHKLGVVPFREAFAESSNIGFIKLAAQLGPERLDTWIRRFGIGRRIDSPEFSMQSEGIYRPREQWSRLTMGSLPMGQEVSVTLLQLARAFCILANGGYWVEPYLVEKAVARDGTVTYQHTPAPAERILSEATVQTMRDLCHGVVQYGTGRYADIPEYRVGGKTGTAQIAEPGRGYVPDRFTTIFAGFAPVHNPRLVAVIVIEEPMIKLHFGGYVCGPVFRDVIRDALIRMGVPEDPTEKELLARAERKAKEATKEAVSVAKNLPKSTDGKDESADVPLSDTGTELLEEENLEDPDSVVARMSFEELETSPLALLAPLNPTEDSGAKQGEDTRTLPNFYGMSKRDALRTLHEYGLPYDLQGAGWVTEQKPAPGVPIRRVAQVRLRLSPSREGTEHAP